MKKLLLSNTAIVAAAGLLRSPLVLAAAAVGAWLLAPAGIDLAALSVLGFVGAVANTKSNEVTNADASPVVMNSPLYGGARLREKAATVETAAADDAASVYRFFRVWSGWRISQLLVGHDAVTNMSTADIGIHQTADNGGAVVDADFFADALDISSASSGMVDRTYERTNTRISDIEKPLWEQLGLSADPQRFYDVTVTATTNDPTAAATISMLIRYVDGT